MYISRLICAFINVDRVKNNPDRMANVFFMLIGIGDNNSTNLVKSKIPPKNNRLFYQYKQKYFQIHCVNSES